MKTRWLLCSIALFGGAWTGAMTSHSPACAREGIAVTLSQNGTAVTGSFRTSCQGMLELRSAMNGDSLAGELYDARYGVRIGQISGMASRTSIRLTTWGQQARDDDGPRVRAVST